MWITACPEYFLWNFLTQYVSGKKEKARSYVGHQFNNHKHFHFSFFFFYLLMELPQFCIRKGLKDRNLLVKNIRVLMITKKTVCRNVARGSARACWFCLVFQRWLQEITSCSVVFRGVRPPQTRRVLETGLAQGFSQ